MDNPPSHPSPDNSGSTPPGATPQAYRHAAEPIPGFRLVAGTLTVRLLGDPHRAGFTFDCVVEPEHAFASEEWAYDIPAAIGEIADHRAWDATGNLQTELQASNGRGSRLRIRFRHMVSSSGPYRFSYTYEAPVRAVVTTRALSRSVAYAGWVIFNLSCDAIDVCIVLPPRSRLVSCVPAAAPAQAAPGRVQIHYPLERLRTLEAAQWLVAYETRRLGLALYLWTAAQLASAAVGWMLGRTLDGWMGSR